MTKWTGRIKWVNPTALRDIYREMNRVPGTYHGDMENSHFLRGHTERWEFWMFSDVYRPCVTDVSLPDADDKVLSGRTILTVVRYVTTHPRVLSRGPEIESLSSGSMRSHDILSVTPVIFVKRLTPRPVPSFVLSRQIRRGLFYRPTRGQEGPTKPKWNYQSLVLRPLYSTQG